MDSKAAVAPSRYRSTSTRLRWSTIAGLDETVAIPLLEEFGGPASGRSGFRHLEQERP